MARLIAQLIEAQKHRPHDTISRCAKTRVQVNITGRSDAGLVSQSNAYPAGFKLMLRARAKSTNRFVRWQDAAGASISTLAILHLYSAQCCQHAHSGIQLDWLPGFIFKPLPA